MGPQKRLAADLVESAQALTAEAPRLAFGPLVAFLERLTPGAARVGGLGPVGEELLRFRHHPSLTFHAGDVASVALRDVPPPPESPDEGRRVLEVCTQFLGVTGAVTPLPLYLAEEVAQEDPDRPVRRELLDVFHHRLLSLLYRLEAKYRLAGEMTSDLSDDWSRRLQALAGLDRYEGGKPTALEPWRLLRILPLLASSARTAERLEMALEGALGAALEGARVAVRQFEGRWVEIEPERRFRLGRANHALGRTTVLGSRAYDRSGRLRIEIAPLPPRAYKRLLPSGDLLPAAREVVRLFAREPFEYTLELGLAEGSTLHFLLDSHAPPELGRDTWLGQSRRRSFTVSGDP